MRFGDSGGEPLASGYSVGGVVGSEEEVRTGAGSGLTWEAKEMLYAICRVVEFFWQNDDPDGRRYIRGSIEDGQKLVHTVHAAIMGLMQPHQQQAHREMTEDGDIMRGLQRLTRHLVQHSNRHHSHMRESSKCKEARSDSAGEQVGGGSGGANHHTVNAAGSAGPGWGMSRGASEGWRRLASEGSLESSKCEQVPYQNLHALETLWISLMCPSSSSYAGATSSFCGTGLVCSAEAQVKKMKEHAIAGAGGEDGDGAGVGERQELGHVSASHAARMRERQGTCESQEPLHRERAGHVIEENKGFKGAGTCMDARRNKGASFVENVESEILVGRVFEGGMGVMERMYLRMLESEDREYDSMLARWKEALGIETLAHRGKRIQEGSHFFSNKLDTAASACSAGLGGGLDEW